MLLLVAYAVVFGAILITLNQLSYITGGYGILDFDIGYSVDRVAEVFGSYGEAGFALYRRIQFLDLVNPALYSLILSVLTYLIWKGRGRDWLCLIPFLGGIGDYAENVTLFLLVQSFPAIPENLVVVSSALSLMKNGLMFLGLMPLLAGVLFWVLGKVRPA